MKLVNLCPHPVHVQHADGTESVIPQEGMARVAVAYEAAGTVDVNAQAVQIIQGTYGEVTGLPEPVAGQLYLVSHMVRMALPHRRDLLSPVNVVRDEQGKILACKMFEANRAG